MSQTNESDYEMTLDPPGRIAIIGAGPLGIEAALYGRFLGYEVVAFEKGEIGESFRSLGDTPLPMLPDRCLTPLAVSALNAQDRGLILPSDPTYPLTVQQWIENGLMRVAATDLLQDRITTYCAVIAIECIGLEQTDVEDDNDDVYIDGEVPADFRLTLRDPTGVRTVEAEAVIVATGDTPDNSIAGYVELAGTPYLFRLGQALQGTEEQRLHQGWHQIVSIYASLAGRAALDLYRPARS